MAKLSPQNEQALDVAAAMYALKTQPDSSDLLDKVRAVELAVKRRRATLGAMFGMLMLACSAAQDDGPGCDLVVSFSDQARSTGQAALARINAATGCAVHESAGGVPVELAPEVIGEDGLPDCGQTRVVRRGGSFSHVESVTIATQVDQCNSREATMVHELLHAMAPKKGLHSTDGVFAAVSGQGELINSSTLETVCSYMVCPAFAPEH